MVRAITLPGLPLRYHETEGNQNMKNRTRELRDAKGMTQEDLADKTGLGGPVISQFERTLPELLMVGRVVRVADALGVSMLELLGIELASSEDQ